MLGRLIGLIVGSTQYPSLLLFGHDSAVISRKNFRNLLWNKSKMHSNFIVTLL